MFTRVWKFCEKPDDFVLVELYTSLNTLIENSEVCLTRKSVIFRVHEFTLQKFVHQEMNFRLTNPAQETKIPHFCIYILWFTRRPVMS